MSLLGYWKLDESSMENGDPAADSSGAGNHGTYQHGPYPEPLEERPYNTPLLPGMEVEDYATWPDPRDTPGYCGMEVVHDGFSFLSRSSFTCGFKIKLPANWWIPNTDLSSTRTLLGAFSPTHYPGQDDRWGFTMVYATYTVRFFRGHWGGSPYAGEDMDVVDYTITPDQWCDLRGTYDGDRMTLYDLTSGITLVGRTPSSRSLTAPSGNNSKYLYVGGLYTSVVGSLTSFRYCPRHTGFRDVYVWNEVRQPQAPAAIKHRYSHGR